MPAKLKSRANYYKRGYKRGEMIYIFYVGERRDEESNAVSYYALKEEDRWKVRQSAGFGDSQYEAIASLCYKLQEELDAKEDSIPEL